MNHPIPDTTIEEIKKTAEITLDGVLKSNLITYTDFQIAFNAYYILKTDKAWDKFSRVVKRFEELNH